MKFFIDTANLDEIAEAKSWGCLAGVTTNPSLYAKTGGKLADFEPHMLKIAELCAGLPVSAESTAPTVEGMVEEGRRLSALAPNIRSRSCARGSPSRRSPRRPPWRAWWRRAVAFRRSPRTSWSSCR